MNKKQLSKINGNKKNDKVRKKNIIKVAALILLAGLGMASAKIIQTNSAQGQCWKAPPISTY